MLLQGSRAFIRQALAILACAMAAASAAQAADVERWRMATEYPATAMPGEGVASFAHEVALRTGGALEIVPSYDAAAGIKSAAMPTAQRDGRLEAGDASGARWPASIRCSRCLRCRLSRPPRRMRTGWPISPGRCMRRHSSARACICCT
ncbi:signal peptide protein [Ralstonia solanacearum SD54]|nr:signal peptide protein [Ralstonia solanacearum SD54]